MRYFVFSLGCFTRMLLFGMYYIPQLLGGLIKVLLAPS